MKQVICPLKLLEAIVYAIDNNKADNGAVFLGDTTENEIKLLIKTYS